VISEIRIARLGPRRDLDNKPDRTSAKLRRDPPTAELVRPRSTEVEIKGYTVSSRGVIDGCRDGETGSWCRDSERHNRRRRAYRGAPQSTRLRRTPEGPERAMSAQAHSSAARRSRDEREPQEPSENQARKGVVSNAREQPPVGGHRGGGQARSGVDLVLLVSLVGWVCSSSAQKEAKNSAATLSVSFLDAPCSAPLKSWLVVARSASARLRLVGHLGWVHQHEACPVGQPRERM